HPGMWKNDAPQNANPVLGWYLDFSWGTQATGVKSKSGSDMRLSSPYAGAAGAFAKRIANVNSYASVQGKWQEQWTTPTEDDAGDFPISTVEEPPSYPEFWAKTGVGLLAMGTLNDTMETIDTPRDTFDNVNFDNLSVQARTALTQIQVGLESQIDSPSPGAKNFGVTKFSRVTGKALRFNLRSGIDAQDPVPDILVYYPGIKTSESGSQNTSTYRGVRKGIPLITLLNGSYTLPLESTDYGSKPVVFGFHLDRKTGLFDRVVDQGQIGTQVKDPKFKMIEGKEVVKDLIVTDVYPKVFFPEPDPVDYAAMGDGNDNQLTTIYDALLNGVPQHYGYINPAVDYSETDINSNIILMPPGRSMRVATQKSIIYKLLLTGEVTPENAKGKGYYVGPLPDGDRNLSLPLTTLLIAQDMYNLAVRQNDKFSSHGISDKVVMASTDRAKEKLDEAKAHFDQKDWQAGNGAAREAWGILVKVYPSILTLGREAVFSVIILMALLLPACIFLEKLIVGSKGIITQLIWTAGLFSLGVIFLNFFHPAFQISVSPFIVMISFIMILMSSVVLLISYQRFEVLVRRARAAGGEVEGEEISLMSSLSTALSLGVSNLKKRPSRTFLTTLTVSVLTFSIISFVSVKGQDEIFRRTITLDQVDGQDKTPEKPAYAGVLFRNFYWTELSNSFLSAIYSEYGTRYDMTTRGFYIQAEGGNNADRENINIINVQFGKKKAVITALMGFQPNEVSFSKLNEAVTKKSWFRAEDTANKIPADRFTVILPDRVAKELGITEDMIFDAAGNRKVNEELPTVSMKNYSWKVIGILNTKQADRIRDINGKSLAIVDFLRSGFTKNVGNAGELLNEQVSYQMKWDVLAIVPMSVQSETQIRPRAVAIRFKGDDKKNVDTFFNDVKLRMNRAMFVGNSDGTVQIVTTKKQSNIGGLAKIIVPVILCILIVLNTMMGTVDERKGEVGMLGAIGLSPAQISFLLLSESAVYSVLGIIFGTFTGLLFGWFTTHSSSLSGLSVNFTSLSSIALAMGTGLIVLIATIVPARRAAMLAAPSGMESWELPTPSDDMKIHFALPFTLTRGNAVGMLAFFRRFLSNHTESTSEDFNCRNIRINQDASEDPALVVRTDMWLAPYDLDVAQHLIMRVSPTENEGVFGVMILLERTSGTEEAWLRTNYAFMNLVRHQFLLWRNLDNASRLKYIAEGAQLFQEAGQ
ncbi:MAG: FtsX-like permease family protein, partial [bacterium]